MTDETTLAFETIEARAVASAKGAPLDRISVRDYTVDVDIGAFQIERGVRQRVRFNVVLEVSRHAAAATDDVDQVISYDSIVEAIDYHMSVERMNLLETLAERIAEQVLANPKAVRVFVRIEKMDRIPGTLGIDIVRSRVGRGNVTPMQENLIVSEEEPHPLVVFMPNKVLHSDSLCHWLDAIEAHALPAIICLEKTGLEIPQTGLASVDRRLGLLSIEQNAWVLAGKDNRCVVVDSRTELDWAMKNGQLSVWAPSKVVLDAVNKPEADADTPLTLAQWFAREFSADHISVIEGFSGAMQTARLQVVTSPDKL